MPYLTRVSNVEEGRFQVKRTKSTYPPAKFAVIDTTGKTLGERFVCTTDTIEKADIVASALNNQTGESNA